MNEFNECVHEVFSAAGDIITGQMSSLISSQAGNLILKRVEVMISEDENVKGYRGIGSGNGLHGIFLWIRKDTGRKI